MVQGTAERLELLPYTDTVWFRFPFTVLTLSCALLDCPVVRTIRVATKRVRQNEREASLGTRARLAYFIKL